MVVWTHRIPLPEERDAIQNLIRNNALPGCSGRHIVWYSGNDGTMQTPHGPIHVTYNETTLAVTLKFDSPDEWTQFIWGQFNKNGSSTYDSGTTRFTNILETVDISGTKTWVIEGDAVPANPVLTLSRTITTIEGEGEDAVEVRSEPEVVKVTQGENVNDIMPVWTGSGMTRTYTYSGLPKYDHHGNEYTYSVSEVRFTVGSGEDAVIYTVVKNADGTYTVTADKDEAPVFTVTQTGNNITNASVRASIEIIKVEKGHRDSSHTLSGAKFRLTRVNDTNNNNMTGDDAYQSEIVTVDSDTGKVIFEDLKPGRYKLEEMESPDGYVLVETPWFITIDMSGTATLEAEYTMASEAEEENSFYIENEPGAELPSTGGPGTRLIYLFGIMLAMLGGAALLIRTKRNSK